MIAQRAHRWAAFALAMALAGCEIIPGAGPAPSLFNLTPKSTFAEGIELVAWQLVIEEPLAAGGLDSNRIALRPMPTELKYFAEARWTERAPRMVQTLLIESFENTDKIVAVGRQVIGLRADYNLKTELREFQAEYFDHSSVPFVRVRINAKIIRQPRQVIIASLSFEERLEADGSSMREIVRSFDRALGKVIKRLVTWALRTPPRGS